MQCPACNQENSPQAKFCQACGTALARSCQACGTPLPAAAKFCPECGASAGSSTRAASPLPAGVASRPSAEGPGIAHGDRRQATVVFADLVGYSALCERNDPEEVQALLSRFYALMDRVVVSFGGQVIDHAGDGLMVVFGAPVAHGNDAERAVRGALDMHAAAETLTERSGQPLQLHIGIATGEVVAAVIMAGANPKYSVTGETVNLAARLAALATARETLITERLYRAVAHVVDAESLGPRSVKGIARPVQVWRLSGVRPRHSELLPFVGRQAELRQLEGALDAVLSTRAGVAIFVRGEAGIGKSRLVEELRCRAADRGYRCHTGHVLDFGVARGQDAIAVVLREVLQIVGAGDEVETRAAIARAIQAGLVEQGEEMYVNDLLDLDQPPDLQPLFDAMDSASRRERAGDALSAVVRRASAVEPRLVVIEDIHWGTPVLLRYLAALTAALRTCPVILAMTSRIEGDPLDSGWRAATRGSSFMTIDVAPLRDEEARLLAGELVEASNRFAVQCIERAEGNPLFLEQLLRAARESEDADVPPTIQSLVLARMDRLAPRDKLALQAAAVVGKRFTLDALRQVSSLTDYSCEALVAADLVRPDRGEHTFAHALIQEGVYSSILKGKRRDLHRLAAEALGQHDPVLRAEHLDRAEDPAAAQAYLVAASAEASRLRQDVALRLADRGLALAAATPARCALALLRGDLLREAGRSQESIEAFRNALDWAGEDADRCRAWMGIGAANRVTGDLRQALAALAEAQPIAERLGMDAECSRIHHLRGNLYFAGGEVERCREQHQLALDYARRCANEECEAQALSGLGDAQYAVGHILSAQGYFRRCVEICERQGWIRLEIPNRCMVAHCLWYDNQIARSIEEAEAAGEAARRVGLVQGEIFARESLSCFLLDAGRFAELEEACRRCLLLAGPAGARRFASAVHYVLAIARLQEGRCDEAKEELERALTLARETGMAFLGAPIFGGFARLAQTDRDRKRALAEGEACLREPCVSHCHLWFYREAMDAVIAAGEWSELLRYADALQDYVRREPLPWASLMVRRARALADIGISGATHDRLQHLRQVRDDIARAGLGLALGAVDAVLSAA